MDLAAAMLSRSGDILNFSSLASIFLAAITSGKAAKNLPASRPNLTSPSIRSIIPSITNLASRACLSATEPSNSALKTAFASSDPTAACFATAAFLCASLEVPRPLTAVPRFFKSAPSNFSTLA